MEVTTVEKLRYYLVRCSDPAVVKTALVLLTLVALIVGAGAPDASGLPRPPR
jgi:hypothetical protein